MSMNKIKASDLPYESLRDEILHSDVFLCSKEYLCSKGYAADWAVSARVNALYKLNYKSHIAEYVTSFPDEKNIGGLYSWSIYKLGNKLMFSPVLASHLTAVRREPSKR